VRRSDVQGPRSDVLLIGHRGDCRDHPENTQASFDAAFAAGVDGVELDLRPTADGAVVICHDSTLARFRGGRRPLARQRLDQLRRIDVGSWFDARFADQRLLSLDALLARYRRRGLLLLELKSATGRHARALNRRLCEAMVASVQRAKAHARVLVLCFDPRLLALVAALDPRLRLVRNCDRRPRDPGRWLDGQPWLDAVDFDRRILSQALVAACHDRGLRVFTYTCNDHATLGAALATGIDGVLSDRAGWLVGRMRARIRRR
jgi:glycerophosphoryl diester phosphodiesterase